MIVLPWPDKGLSPNVRMHWAPKAELKAAARSNSAKETLAQVSHDDRARLRQAEEIPVEIRFYPPDHRHRDSDNMVASFKSHQDGIADALGVKDRRFKPHYFFEEPCKPGRVEVSFPTRHEQDQGLCIPVPDSVSGLPPEETEAA